MSRNDTLYSAAALGFIGLGIAAIGYAFGVRSKMKEVCEKLDLSIDKIANDTEVEIPKKLVDQAVKNAVDREAYTAVKRVAETAADDIRRDIANRVRTEIESRYEDISEDVTSEIAKSVAKIDENRLKREVVAKAKEQIAEKFDDKLDGLLEEFNGNLQNVGRIYKSIAKSMSKEDI